MRSADQLRPRARTALQGAGPLFLAAGAVLCVLGWYGVSGERFAERQIPYLASGTVPGAALIVAGAVLLGRGERTLTAERMKELHSLLVRYGDAAGPQAPAAAGEGPRGEPEAAAQPAPEAAQAPVAVPGGTLLHRPGCPLVAGKPEAFRVSPALRRDRALAPCPVCEPDAGSLPGAVTGPGEQPPGPPPEAHGGSPKPGQAPHGPTPEAGQEPGGRRPPGPEPPQRA
jgi:hypothetical protein